VLAHYELIYTMGGLLETIGVPVAAASRPKTGTN
jgi:hypothetical protein